MTSTPYYTQSTPEKHGEWLAEKLAGIGEKVMELRRSPYHKYYMLRDDYTSLDAKANASISSEYIEQARRDRIANTVQVNDRLQGNAIICGRLSL